MVASAENVSRFLNGRPGSLVTAGRADGVRANAPPVAPPPPAGAGAEEAGGVAQQNAALCGAFADHFPPCEDVDNSADLEATLTPAQRRGLALMLMGHTTVSVAREVGVNRATVFRWKADSVFGAALRARQEAILDGAGDRLRALLSEAVDAVEWGLGCNDRSVRMRVALRLLPYITSPKLRPREPKDAVKDCEEKT